MHCSLAILFFLISTPAFSSMLLPHPSEGEPTAIEVQEAARRYARLESGEADRWKKRSGLSALLPRLQVDYLRRTQNTVDVNINDSVYVGANGSALGPDEGSISQNVGAGQNVGAHAVWNLSELIFNRDQLAVSNEARNLIQTEQALLAEVNRQYFRRRQLQGDIELIQKRRYPLKPGERKEHVLFTKEVERGEATAALDALTGGWLSRELEIRKSSP